MELVRLYLEGGDLLAAELEQWENKKLNFSGSITQAEYGQEVLDLTGECGLFVRVKSLQEWFGFAHEPSVADSGKPREWWETRAARRADIGGIIDFR